MLEVFSLHPVSEMLPENSLPTVSLAKKVMC